MGNGGADTKDDAHRQGTRRTFAPWTDPAARALVRFDGVSKQFSAVAAVERLSLDIFPGEFFALLGPSGCGKTTLLRLLAGLDMPDEGRILLDGEDIAQVPPYRRDRRSAASAHRRDRRAKERHSTPRTGTTFPRAPRASPFGGASAHHVGA